MFVCTRAKFQVPSITLKSFRQVGVVVFLSGPLPPTQYEPLKSPLRLGLKKFQKSDKVLLCKLFPYLYCPYTLEYKKILFTILITSCTAYQSLFGL